VLFCGIAAVVTDWGISLQFRVIGSSMENIQSLQLVILITMLLSFMFFKSPCCDKVYSCRLCHDENERHQIDRHAVMFIICQVCSTRQSVRSRITRVK